MIKEVLSSQFFISFFVMALTFVFGLSIPLWFWKLSAFKELAETLKKTETENVSFQYKGGIREFASRNAQTSRTSIYWSCRTMHSVVDVLIDELRTIFVVFSVGQLALLVMLALSREEEASGPMHGFVHYPITEIGILIITGYVSWKVALEWRRTKQWFRLDALSVPTK